MTPGEIRELVDGLLDDCGLADAKRIGTLAMDRASGFEGVADIHGTSVNIQVRMPFGFPRSPPELFVLPGGDDVGQVPHLLRSGFLCVRETEDLVLDRSRPAELVRQWIQAGIRLLEDGVSGANAEDLRAEWEVYWAGQRGVLSVDSYFDPGEHLATLQSWYEAGAPIAVAKDGEAPKAYSSKREPPTAPRGSALYLPLRSGAPAVPPRWGAKCVVPELHRLLQHLEDGARRDLEHVLSKGRVEVVLFGLPRQDQGLAVFGVWFPRYQGPHPLLHEESEAEVTPLSVRRLDKSFLVPRGGADVGLDGKKVAVIGCGAVGGHIAFELVRSGVLRLALVDFDVMRPENAFRHVLGNSAAGQLKATALAERLVRTFPYTGVLAVPDAAEWLEIFDRFGDFHAVVVATGNPALDLHLQAVMRARGRPGFAVFTWLEPWGLGGHAVAVEPGGSGCLRCLYTDNETGEMAFRAAFAEPGQSFKVDVAGCGSRYTPFGSLDAVRTAELATRLVVGKLNGTIVGNPLRSWKGDPEAFRNAGLRTTDRFELSVEELATYSECWTNDACPECS